MEIDLTLHKRKKAIVIPIIVKPCKWSDTPISSINALPRKGKAITTWPNRDDAYSSIANDISQLLKRDTI